MSEAQVLTKLEQASGLDPASERVRQAVDSVIRPQRLRDALHGVWLGHPLHPAMVQAPVGAWMATAVLDALPDRRFPGRMSGMERAATALTGFGVATAVPSAVAGWTDFSTLSREQQRVGLVHAVSNLIAVGLYTGSFVARLAGRRRAGKALAYAGMGIASLGAYLGGHMAYGLGAGVNHSIADLRHLPDGWQPLVRFSELPDGEPTVRRMGEVPVLVYRQGAEVTVLMERCGHQSGPLGEGQVVRDGGDPCVVCPWHGSVFRLRDGAVMHGPAATDQPVLASRISEDGLVEARLP
ncbi:Rieske 2Fe-2S domain-containing protein [Rhizomonospora bruguierae]|uniref:Rieske 2Fe-2S domain-containing protein n=1 Tax=Rhizomonospora bruguierae TaxID=1581705 RepID=UPI001BCB0B2A|nr:Rieske 2Fe-2S domain-containing protein [Micromonospora sp. NBRC 107566]